MARAPHRSRRRPGRSPGRRSMPRPPRRAGAGGRRRAPSRRLAPTAADAGRADAAASAAPPAVRRPGEPGPSDALIALIVALDRGRVRRRLRPWPDRPLSQRPHRRHRPGRIHGRLARADTSCEIWAAWDRLCGRASLHCQGVERMGQEQGGVLATLDRVNEPRTASQVLGRTLRGRYRVLEPISAGRDGRGLPRDRHRDRHRGRAQAVHEPASRPAVRGRGQAALEPSQHPRVVRDHRPLRGADAASTW